ncbi:MAG: hypothetical protein AB1646_21410 [Thermodesulfobacteriota bacterium]
MAFNPEHIITSGAGVDNLLSQALKLNANLDAIAAVVASVEAAQPFSATCTALTGGGPGALDALDVGERADGACVMVVEGSNPARVYFYRLDGNSSAPEDSPYVIVPDTNPGTKRWVLAARVPRLWTSAANPQATDDVGTGVRPGDQWRVAGRLWICVDDAAGAAIWREMLPIGTTGTSACAGNDQRLLTADERAALAAVALSGANPVVVDNDPRLTNARVPLPHGAGHLTDVDFDRAPIDVALAHVVPDTNPVEVDAANQLGAIIKGLDNAIGDLAGSGATAAVAALQNSLVMLAWDMYTNLALTSDPVLDDLGICTFEDANGINAAQSSGYVCENGYVMPEPESPGHTADLDVVDAGDLDVLDYKGTIAYWQKTDTNKGFFSTDAAGSTPVTIKQGGSTNPNAKEGLAVNYSGGAAIILTVIEDGDQADQVVLSSDIADATAITSITSLMLSGGNLTTAYGSSDWALSASVSFVDGNASYTNQTLRLIVPASALGKSGTSVRVTFRAPSGAATTIDHASIVERSGATANGTTTPTELLFSGVSGTTIPANGTVTSDPLIYPIDETKDYLVPMDVGSSSGSIYQRTSGGWGFYYSQAVGDSWNVQNMPANYTNAGYQACVTSIEVMSSAKNTDRSVAVSTADLEEITTDWAHITAIEATQSVSGGSTAFHAASLNMGQPTEEWWVYLAAAWRGIVRNNSGVWQYMDSGGTYQNATTNARLSALLQAFAVTENQMTATQLAAITEAQWDTRLSDTSTNNHSLGMCVALQSDGGTAPTLDKWHVTYVLQRKNMVLLLNSWDAQQDNPAAAYGITDIEAIDAITLGTDIKLYISTDNGTNFEEVSDLQTFREITSHSFVRGDTALAAQNDHRMVAKVTTHNLKQLKLHAIAIGV